MTDNTDPAAARFERVAATFTEVATAVPSDGWDRRAPCDGWVARDVVEHLVTWVPAVLGRSGVVFPDTSTLDDPAERWRIFAATITAALADPDISSHRFDAGPPGKMTVEAAIDMLVTGDVLVHTWDLAVATGQTVQLDPVVVHDMYQGMAPMDEMLRASGHYGPRVEVADDADPTTQLLAFTGRDVAGWT